MPRNKTRGTSVASMVSMMIFGLGFDFCSIFKAWRIDVSRHRFLPFLGSFSFRHFYRNDVVRHWCWLDRNDLMRHAERCLRTRHTLGHHVKSRDVVPLGVSRFFVFVVPRVAVISLSFWL